MADGFADGRKIYRSRCYRSCSRCFIIQIFFRYVLNDPIGWTEEVIVTTWLWTVLWGAAFILGEAEEIRFDIIYSNISEGVKRIFTVITGVARHFCTAFRCPPHTAT